MPPVGTPPWGLAMSDGNEQQNFEPRADQASLLAMATFLFGAGAWIFLPIIGGLVALGTGAVELRRIRDGESSNRGRQMTLVGLALGAGNVTFTTLFFGVMLAVFGFALLTSDFWSELLSTF